MARAASDLAVAAQIEGLMADVMMPEEIAGCRRAARRARGGGLRATPPLEDAHADHPRLLRPGPRGQARACTR